MVKASSAAASKFTSRPSVTTAKPASVSPKASASPGLTRPIGTGRRAVRVITRVDVGVVPHVERAGRARADRDAEQRGEADQRMQRARRDRQGPTSAVNMTSDITRGFISAT